MEFKNDCLNKYIQNHRHTHLWFCACNRLNSSFSLSSVSGTESCLNGGWPVGGAEGGPPAEDGCYKKEGMIIVIVLLYNYIYI